MKKIIAMILVIALTAAISVGATMAYLTDTDEEVNVMTVGNVQIKLQEKQRNEDGSALEDFEQGKELTPLVGSAQGEKDRWGQPTASNYVDKIVYASNTGKNDAYIRFLVALPKALVKPDAISDNILHWSFGNRVDITGESKYNGVAYADSEWAQQFGDYFTLGDSVTIDNEEYMVTVFTMKDALAPGNDSLAVMAGMYLDKRVGYDADLGKYTFDGVPFDYDLSQGVKVPVLVQAVQTAGFDSAEAAVNEAFGEANVVNAEAWFEGVEIPAVVDTADELVAALAEGGNAVMTADVDAGGQVFVVDGGTLDGAGNTLTVDSGDAAYESGLTVTEGTVKNVTVTGAFRGLGVGGSGASEMTGDVTYENVTVTGATYGINIGIGNGHKLTMINCKLGDWNSYSGLSGAEFIGCTFTSEGNYYASQRISANATFTYTNCSFKQNTYDNADGAESYYLDSYGNGTIVFENCYMDGVLITEENVNTLFQISPKNNTTVTVNNG